MEFGGRWLRALALALAVLGGSLASGAAGLLLSATPAMAQSERSIVVQGNRRVDADTIRSYFHTKPGEKLDALKIDDAYKGLLATGMFEDVHISQAGGRLVVTVVESGVINRVQFEGNKNVKDEQLAAEVQSKPRAPFSRQTVRADVQRILDIYHAAGRYDVRVDPKTISLPNGRVDLVFEITEGKKTVVKSITFVGNHAYSSSRLKDVIKTAESGIFSFFKNNDIYDGDRVEQDRNLLRKFYLGNGYADVRIASAVAQFDPNKRGFFVTYTIDEGPQYRFGKVDIQSNVRDLDPARLRSVVQVSAGAVYNADGVENSVEKMSLELAKSGYAFAQVRPRGDRNFQSRTIDLTFVIDQGTRAYIERINIRGNTRTRDYVIRREFDIGEGDAYNHALIERAERRLKNLGYFKTVKITSAAGSAPDRVIVNVDVEEQSTGEFTVAGGYSTSNGFMAEVSVGERNLLGRGQFAKATVQYGQVARGFQLSFVEPYLLDYRLAFGVDIFARDTLPSIYQSYELRTAGGGFRFGIPITENLTTQLRYSAYTRQIDLNALNNCFPFEPGNTVDANGALIPACTPAAASIRLAANSGETFTSLAGYTLTYNTLDNNKNAHKGMLLELKQDFAGVGGDVNFIRTTADARWYRDIGWDITSLVHLQAGHVTSWGGQQLGMFDHFFMGPNLVRGFEIAGIGPRDMTSNCPAGSVATCSTYDALGGTMYWGASLELQYPLAFAPKDFGMRLATFVDAGSLWDYRGPTTCPLTICTHDTIQQVITPRDSNVIRSSVGVGLIWDSPFGPLRFDYAIALTKDNFTVTDQATGQTVTTDRTQAFRFSGGTKF
jgi:outer membrane protein insertion porin family